MAVERGHDSLEFAEPVVPEPKLEPITVRICDAIRLTGISRTALYRLIRAGKVETVKLGRCTLIRYRSLKKLTGD
ncbi:MAG: DNA-binding protein [Oxalobacteraceae bacterium]|nr:MAG: DNA-binding protein [Oxalobacteraceae bacterium]